MNEHAKLWVERLRSGEFQQGRGRLRRGDSYCCLGVACELYRQEVGGEWLDADEDGTAYRFVDDHHIVQGSILPMTVVSWLGLRYDGGEFEEHSSLIDMNDSGSTFKQIADLIELEPRGLFKDSA